MSIKPLNDVVLVRLDDPEKLSTIIEVPGTVAQPLRKGTVLAVGPGRTKLLSAKGTKTVFIPTTVRVGERFVFFAAATDTKQGKQIQYSLPEDQALIREEDILFTFEEDVKVTV